MNERTLIVKHSTNPDDPSGTERRYALLQRHKEMAEHYVSQSTDKDVLILILDITEPAIGINVQWRLKCLADDTIPAIVYCVPRWTAYKAMKQYQRHLNSIDQRDPKVSPVVEKLAHPAPEGTFYALVISKGKQLAEWPIV